MSGPPVTSLLELSRAHLPAEIGSAGRVDLDGVDVYPVDPSSGWLVTLDGILSVEVEPPIGWLLTVPTDHRELDRRVAAFDVPDSIVAIWRYALTCGCGRVLFIRDAEIVAELPIQD